MPRKDYDWEKRPILEPHTATKHEILQEYFRQYLLTRCKLPKRERFRLIIVDGFCGGGLYRCGAFGSPLIFVSTLIDTLREINITRVAENIRPIEIECLLICNDSDQDAIDILKTQIAPCYAQSKEEEKLSLKIEYMSKNFDRAYPELVERIKVARCQNVLFNLDQCGYSHITTNVIRDVMRRWDKAEVILTFMVSSMLAYLSEDADKSGAKLEPSLEEKINKIRGDESLLERPEWLGEAERIVYEHLRACGQFVSPFSIENKGGGWTYWLMHFANNYRAREVYNNILHENERTQGHYGRAGLRMLEYGGETLYLFDNCSRQYARESLPDDIGRFIAESGDTLLVNDFYSAAYSETPAHSEDISQAIIEHPDIDVITPAGGLRRQASTIKPTDVLKLVGQRSFIFNF